ncbi:MAG TPA: hypothetical protein VE153_03470 [Myxococcus sp.]|nr:hypothetical protein [Myxococcus sp.]
MVSSAAMRSLLLVLLPAVGLARAGSEPSPSPAPEDSQAELDSLPAPPLTSADVPPRSARLLVDP